MSDDAPITSDPLEAIRREIDGVDANLLALFAQRQQIAERLVGLKAPTPGLPLRPGREISMLRNLIAKAPAPLEPELVVELWRTLMAASLRRQREIEIVVGGGRSDQTRLFDLARRHFGARTRIQLVDEAQTALQRATENPETMLVVTPWPAAPGLGAWWPALAERRFHSLNLIMGLPMLGPRGEDPEVAVFAASPPEPAGEDVSLILAFDPHHRVQRALNETGFAGKEIARAEPRVLLRLDGFVARDDARVGALTRFGLDSPRVLGSFARV